MYDSALDGPLEQNMLDLPRALQSDGRTRGSGSQRFRSRFVDWLVRLDLFDDLNRRAVHVVASLRLMVHESVAGRPSAVEIAGRGLAGAVTRPPDGESAPGMIFR